MNFMLNFFNRKISRNNRCCANNDIDPYGNIFPGNYQVNICSVKNETSHDRRHNNRFSLFIIPHDPGYSGNKKRSGNYMYPNKNNWVNLIFFTNRNIVFFNHFPHTTKI